MDEKIVSFNPRQVQGELAEKTRTSLEEAYPILGDLFSGRIPGVVEMSDKMKGIIEDTASYQPFLAGSIDFIRKGLKEAHRIRTEKIDVGMAGGFDVDNISVHDLTDAESDLAVHLVHQGSVNPDQLNFMNKLTDSAAQFDELYTQFREDKKIKHYVETETKRIIRFESTEKSETERSLSGLIKHLDHNARMNTLLQDEALQMERKTFRSMVEFQQSVQNFFFDSYNTITFHDDPTKNRSAFTRFMMEYFDNLISNYAFDVEYNSFILAQERGLMAAVQSMIDLQEMGYEILPTSVDDDMDYKIDFVAKRDGVEYNVQAKARTRDKARHAYDRTIAVCDPDHLKEFNDPDFLVVSEYPQNGVHRSAFDKFKELNSEHLSDQEGLLWIETEPYVGISDKKLKEELRLKAA